MSTVFFDIDTQNDFMLSAGALHVPGAERILPNITRLNGHAAAHGVIVISTTDAHAENDTEFRDWPPHCVAGTLGQQKPAETLLDRRVVIPSTPGDYSIEGAQQILVEKQALDCFTNPNLPAVLHRLNAERFVVYGVVAEYCVRCAVMGLLKTGKPVELVRDAIQSLNAAAATRAIGEFLSAGGRLTTVETVCAR